MSLEPTIITISNPSNLPLIDYRVVKPLQGDLKDLSKENYNKLKNVLIKRGFRVPLFLWKDPNYRQEVETNGEPLNSLDIKPVYYLMDGHQRQRVMIKENMSPYEVPYILIDAKDEKEARAQLLEISSQYGTITQEGFDTFTAELPEADLADLHFDRLFDWQPIETEDDEEEDEHGSSMPAIKLEFKTKADCETVMAELIELDFTGRYNCELKVLGDK